MKEIAVHLARSRRLPACVEIDDLVSDGSLGLMDAMQKFDPTRGVKFRTYATRRIAGAMLDGIRDRDWVPRLARSRGGPIVSVGSLSAPVASGDDRVCVGDVLEDLDAGSLELDRADWFAHVCRELTAAETLIVRLRFEAQLSMREIGLAVGLCESRICQILSDLSVRLAANLDPSRPEAP